MGARARITLYSVLDALSSTSHILVKESKNGEELFE